MHKSLTRSLGLLLIYIITLTAPAAAQTAMDTLVFRTGEPRIAPEAKGELRATVDALAFMRDNEYESSLSKGYTLPGVWLAPSLSYQPLRNLKVEVGAHMLHFWGANSYPNVPYAALTSVEADDDTRAFHCVPMFRANLQLTPSVNIVLGTLYGRGQHGLAAPLYNDELNLSADPEAGVQLLVETRPVSLDVWVNWDTFIFKNDDGQETFTFGISSRFRPSRRTARAQWYIPLQILFRHTGGEINYEADDRTVKTWLNAATGAGVTVPLRTKLPVRLGGEVLAAYFGQNSGQALPFDNGVGFQAKATAQVWRFNAQAAYWWCKDFISLFGNPLYGAASVTSEGLTFDKPHMVTARVEYSQYLGKGFALGAHADLFHHFGADVHSTTEGAGRAKSANSLAFGIFLRVSPSFLIKKF